jgi:uncharacterized protein YjdB
LVEARGSTVLVESLKTALTQSGRAPTAQIAGGDWAEIGRPVTLRAATMGVFPDDPIAEYSWNFGGGTDAGSYDVTTTSPTTQTTFYAPAEYEIGLRVRTKSGLAALATTKLKVTPPPSSVAVTPAALTFQVGESQTLTATALPASASQMVAWSTSDPATVAVDLTGKVTGLAKGVATVSASTPGGLKADVRVSVGHRVTGIAASSKVLYIAKGRTVKLPFVAYGNGVEPKASVSWSTSKKKVAGIVLKGSKPVSAASGQVEVSLDKNSAIKIKGVKEGSSKLTLTVGGKKLTLKVKVVTKAKKVSGVKIATKVAKNRLTIGKTKVLKVAVSPKTATGAVVSWKSSKPAVISVDAAGRITAKKAGNAVISAKVGAKKVELKLKAVKK